MSLIQDLIKRISKLKNTGRHQLSTGNYLTKPLSLRDRIENSILDDVLVILKEYEKEN